MGAVLTLSICHAHETVPPTEGDPVCTASCAEAEELCSRRKPLEGKDWTGLVQVCISFLSLILLGAGSAYHVRVTNCGLGFWLCPAEPEMAERVTQDSTSQERWEGG